MSKGNTGGRGPNPGAKGNPGAGRSGNGKGGRSVVGGGHRPVNQTPRRETKDVRPSEDKGGWKPQPQQGGWKPATVETPSTPPKPPGGGAGVPKPTEGGGDK